MKAEHLKIFKNITLDYFSKVGPDIPAPVLDEAYLQFEGPELMEYTSMVSISGVYEGCLYLTAPSQLIEELLRLHGEKERTETTRMDMCRELSNVLSGNANRAFGEEWNISVPQSIHGEDTGHAARCPSVFIMPFSWNRSKAFLAIGLERKKDN